MEGTRSGEVSLMLRLWPEGTEEPMGKVGRRKMQALCKCSCPEPTFEAWVDELFPDGGWGWDALTWPHHHHHPKLHCLLYTSHLQPPSVSVLVKLFPRLL